jgi:hypothetical protein
MSVKSLISVMHSLVSGMQYTMADEVAQSGHTPRISARVLERVARFLRLVVPSSELSGKESVGASCMFGTDA